MVIPNLKPQPRTLGQGDIGTGGRRDIGLTSPTRQRGVGPHDEAPPNEVTGGERRRKADAPASAFTDPPRLEAIGLRIANCKLQIAN